jgi:hypothetical protein
MNVYAYSLRAVSIIFEMLFEDVHIVDKCTLKHFPLFQIIYPAA